MNHKSICIAIVFAVVALAQTLVHAQALGPRMDAAIKQMRSLPQVDQRSISMMLASAAQGYLNEKDYSQSDVACH